MTEHDSLKIGGIGAHLTLKFGGSRQGELAEAVRIRWSRCLNQSFGPPGEPVTATLQAAHEPGSVTQDPLAVTGRDAAWLLVHINQAITHSLIQAQTGRLLMFHAGAVSNPRTGRSLVYVAAGGTGKTTLTRVLGRRYGYLSDETVAIDADDRILPYPKPLSERRVEGDAKQELSPDELGLQPAPAAPSVARVLLLERDGSHHGEPDVRELGRLDGIELLAPQTSALYALPHGLHRLARLRETTGPLLKVRYAEATSLLGLVAELIGEAP